MDDHHVQRLHGEEGGAVPGHGGVWAVIEMGKQCYGWSSCTENTWGGSW